MSETILITGGFGYIGRHTCIELLRSGYNVVIVDNKKMEDLEEINNNIFKISGKKAILNSNKINSEEDIRAIFNNFNIDAVIHFAGIKSVFDFYSHPLESMNKELSLVGNLLTVMKEFNIKKIIYPSSIMVYSSNNKMPLHESSKLNRVNPYSKCKIYIEDLLHDLSLSDNSWNIIILRYSNTVGSHQSRLIDGYIPENPTNLTSCLMAYFANEINTVKIFGNNFDTKDGTCERDFIHVVDVANANLASIKYVINENLKRPLILNISSGKNHSVFEVISEFEDVFNRNINYEIMPRRSSDVSCSYSDNSRAKKIIEWEPQSNLNDIVKSFMR